MSAGGITCWSIVLQCGQPESCVTDTGSTVYQPGHEAITPAEDSGVWESQTTHLETCSVRQKTRATHSHLWDDSDLLLPPSRRIPDEN